MVSGKHERDWSAVMVKQKMSEEAVNLVKSRAGWACEHCGTQSSLRWSIHHRKPRGMGGSKDLLANKAANLLLLCGSGTEGCHGWVESNRTKSYELGLLVHTWETSSEVPVEVFGYGSCMLSNEGGKQPC